MATSIYYRIVGHSAALSMHLVNGAIMLSSLKDEVLMKDKQLQELAFMQNRFITVWNIAFQVAYACLALTCDVLTVTNKDHLLPKPIKKFRDLFFSTILFPGTLLVFTVFWPFYLYDREIIFPAFIDKVFSQKSNYVIHICIVPVVLWELAFQPRLKPKSHASNLCILTAYYLIYNIFITYTYYDKGLWPYPLMYLTYGTIYYIPLHMYIYTIGLLSYYIQWPLVELFWGKEKSKKV